MDASNTIPAHALMFKNDANAGHSTKPHGRATQSAFAAYGFGPVQPAGKKSGSGAAAVTGSFGQPPVNPGALSWITQAQASALGGQK
jgi:hypothetical protein